MIGKELGNYRVLEMIGKGGMAIVYRGQHKTLSRRIVAIKMLSASLEGDASFSERFFREAEVMDRLRHPNIVTLYDFIEEKGHYYIVMEYVAGKTLSEIIKEAGGPLSYNEIKTVFQQVLGGIGHAHRLGIVHRDLKPGNIMINEEGEVKITDFGIARLLGNNFETTLTTTGLGIGSPYYMSPEQVLASKEHPISGASDIYSLGITLYQMATGKLPFEGTDSLFTIMQSHVKKTPPMPREIVPDIPASLEDVILRSIQKKPEDRWPSCEAFWESLASALVEPSLSGKVTETIGTAPLESRPPEIKPPQEPPRRKNWTAVLVILVLGVALAGVGSFLVLRHRSSSPPVPPVEETQKPVSEALSEPAAQEQTEETSPAAKKPLTDSEAVAGHGQEENEKVKGQDRVVPEPVKQAAGKEGENALQVVQEKPEKEKEQEKIEQLLNQARAFMGLKEYSKAQDTALKVLKQDPENGKAKEIYAKAKEKKRRILADRAIAQAESHFKTGQYGLAVKETQKALEMYPNDSRALNMKRKLEDLARKTLERRQKIEIPLQQAEAALEEKQYTRAKLIAQQVLDIEPDNKRATRVIQLAGEGQENKMLQDMVKGLLPSVGEGGVPSSPQGLPDQSGNEQIPSLPLPGLPGQ
jgi:serine/threonine protein kinase